MTDKLREAAQLALEALKETSVECAIEILEAALAQQDAQAAPTDKDAYTIYGDGFHDGYLKGRAAGWDAAASEAQQDAQAVPQHLADDERVAALCDLSYVAGMKAGWNCCISDDSDGFERRQNSVGEAIRILKSHRAPTPPAQQDHGELYAQGWINGWQVQSLIDWCNSGCAKRADIAFTGGPSRQIAYAIEHLVKRASNLETSEGVFVPRELLAKVANALGLPYEEEHTRLRSKLLDILSFAAPAQRVMLTDEEIDAIGNSEWGGYPSYDREFKRILRAAIEAYERKNGISQPGYTAPDMASQGASQFRAGHDAAQSEIAELEQENRLLRARNDRLQKEIEQKGER